MHAIYIIQNKVNLKIYIGQSLNPKKRWSDHKGVARRLWLEKIVATHNSVQVVHRAMAKHGINNFEFTILEEFDNQKEADEAEKFWISFFRSRNPVYGYNAIPGGRFGVGVGPAHPNYGKPAHNRLFTDEQEREICRRYVEEQLSITVLANEYSCNQSTIHKLLQRNDVQILGNKVLSKGKRYSRETEFKKGQEAYNKLFSEEQEREIISLYQSGKSTPVLGKMFSCHKSVISRMLHRHEVSHRKRGLSQKKKSLIIVDYKKLGSARKAAELHSVNKSTVLRLFKDSSP